MLCAIVVPNAGIVPTTKGAPMIEVLEGDVIVASGAGRDRAKRRAAARQDMTPAQKRADTAARKRRQARAEELAAARKREATRQKAAERRARKAAAQAPPRRGRAAKKETAPRRARKRP